MEQSAIQGIEEPLEPDVAPDGVDLGLIRWMLSLSPLERLDALQDFVDGALALRDGRVQE
jgi:hypothetical protein